MILRETNVQELSWLKEYLRLSSIFKTVYGTLIVLNTNNYTFSTRCEKWYCIRLLTCSLQNEPFQSSRFVWGIIKRLYNNTYI